MKVIVYDTSAIYGSHFLEDDVEVLQKISENSEDLGIKILTPEIVLDESLNKLKDDIQELNLKARKIANYDGFKLAQKLNSSLSSLTGDIISQDLLKEMTIKLENELRSMGDIVPYPDVNHKDVVKRALDRKNPFDSQGHNGYRDTIIWETLKNILNNDEIDEVYFICRNPKDFFIRDSYTTGNIKLVDVLYEELMTINVEKKLFCYKDLSTVYREKIKSLLDDLDDFKDSFTFLQSEDFLRILSNEIKEYSFRDSFYKESISFNYDSYDVMYVGPTKINEIISAKKLANNIALFELDCEVEIDLDVFVDKWEYDYEENGYAEDWNDYYVNKDVTDHKYVNLIIELNYISNEILSVNFSY